MPSRRLIALGALMAIGISAALACGPFFPDQYLSNRTGTLTGVPVNSFAFEVARLVAPGDDLKAMEADSEYAPPDEAEKRRIAAETQGLTPAQARLVSRMRDADDGTAALRTGASLPNAVRLYTAAAVDFNNGEIEPARTRFEAILALPASERTARATWAAYMIGRAHALEEDGDAAAKAFQLTRALAREGLPDPLGLAVASYGEEARLHLPDDDAPPLDDAAYGGAYARAVALYAEQAARGSNSGVQSLRMIAERLMRAPDRLPAVVADPLLQRLLVVYVLARLQDPAMNLTEFTDFQVPDNRDAPPDALVRLVAAIEQSGAPLKDGNARLASLAYDTGHYDLAARLLAQAEGPLARWIAAKLALRRGDLAEAATLYDAAARALPGPARGDPLDDDARKRLAGERGVLALARGEFPQAYQHLIEAESWSDALHVGERVLTTDELRGLVAPDAPAPERSLLARRLMREHRFAEALPYFDEAEREAAAAYAEAHHQATSRWSGVERARGWFAAARVARRAGLEIMGTEGPPDYAVSDANYAAGGGLEALDGPLITDAERTRFAASAAVPDRRYHYRYVAVDHVLQAAALLPARSQAFAAVLCHATGWMRTTPGEDGTARALYRLYVTRGPAVPWAENFGRDCPEPDFDGAARQRWSQPIAAARQAVRRNLAWLAPSLIAIALGAGWLMWRRRRSFASSRLRP